MINITLASGTMETIGLHPKSTGPSGFFIFLAVLNIFFSITAFLGNALILTALRKVTSIHPPTKLLLQCLAINDLLVGLLLLPRLAVISSFVTQNTQENILYYSNAIAIFLITVSVLTSTAICLDRLLALLLGLRYRHIVTFSRAGATMIWIWFMGCAVIGLKFGTGYFDWARFAMNLLMLLSLLISFFSYVKIYLLLRRQQLQLRGHFQQVQARNEFMPLNIARYKKTVYSIACVQVALLICYLPFTIVGMLLTSRKIPDALGSSFFRATITILCFNSSLNPILYCWRMREVKQAVKDTTRQLNLCRASI